MLTSAAAPSAEELEPARLFRDYAGAVGRWVHRLGGPGVDAEDVIQEVFFRACSQLARFRGEAKLGTWLFRITLNEIGRRRRRERLASLFGARTSHEPPPPGRTPHDELQSRQDVQRLYRALDVLGEKCRTTLVLFEIEELSGEEISELLGIDVGTVWVRLHRARKQLAEVLAQQEREGQP